jgi:MoaA/NifB/PqqE/SkfB family radical SAM enzyme
MRKTETYERYKLPEEEIIKIIDAAAGQNIQSLSFTGGEPFIFKDELIRLIKYASDKKIPLIRTGTNGFLFTDWDSPDYKDNIPVYRQLWKQDLKYYRRCDYFDGRKEYCH